MPAHHCPHLSARLLAALLLTSSLCATAKPAQDRYAALAALPFERGYPTPQTTAALDEELYFQRAVQSYLWAMPAANMVAMKEAQEKLHGTGYNVVAVFEKRLQSRTLITTPNSDVIYGLGFLDLAQSGPVVIDLPPKQQALIDDFWHRPIPGPTINGISYAADLGIPGPDRGQGGKYLILPPGYDKPVDEQQYFVYRSKTNGVFLFLRSFFADPNNLTPAVERMEQIKLYPLNGEAKPMAFKHASDVPANYLMPEGAAYFDLLNRFVQNDVADSVDPYMHGMLWALGIRKGMEFKPTPRQRELLDAAARTGWKMAKNIAANMDRELDALWYSDRKLLAHVLTRQDDFSKPLLNVEFNDPATGHTAVNSKAFMFIDHYSVSPGMATSRVGLGAKYGNIYKDSRGEFLRGENSYSITLPAQPPVNLFWSVAAYDSTTAAGLDNGQPYPSINSKNKPAQNADGSITLYFSPKAPAGKEGNWIKTVPGRGWFGQLRLYGPEQRFFDRSWRIGDFQKLP